MFKFENKITNSFEAMYKRHMVRIYTSVSCSQNKSQKREKLRCILSEFRKKTVKQS
jgi:hypothetical protein